MSAQLLDQTIVRDSKILGTAADQLLVHLEDEQASLAGLLNAVRDVNQALKALDDEALRKSLEAEVRELSSNAAIQQRRHQLRDSLAELLHVNPSEVTLRQLVVMTTGSMRQSIERLWNSLLEMAREMERLNRQNAAMIGQSLAIARGVVEQLTGVTAVNESYNSIGARAQADVGPLMQWGG